ncbi:hypothetical protein bcere0004_55410 [Bacillus cereus BGSC 6E1]|nr:hypothetical protein bcere0004_55410 [Bacillus cereus BGSC 6E1]
MNFSGKNTGKCVQIDKGIILNKNAIWYVNVRALREVPFCNDYPL